MCSLWAPMTLALVTGPKMGPHAGDEAAGARWGGAGVVVDERRGERVAA